jgi:hypothetical protein
MKIGEIRFINVNNEDVLAVYKGKQDFGKLWLVIQGEYAGTTMISPLYSEEVEADLSDFYKQND